ncbi:MAG: hypothetical protein KatS3mg115_2680 [Candidatus Poribacteria bacterium]|nr:MAG: hypothetical protein KatS3mg115_2680 [Candidatus Poribacteria bacterium]
MNPATLCSSIRQALPPLFECSPGPEEAIRVRTPFMYPDGDYIDIFVLQRDNTYTITDFGEALGWLRMQSARRRLSVKQQRLLEDLCLTLGVELFRGQLSIRCDRLGQVGDAVLRLAQAAVRVADLWFTFRTRLVESVEDEVGDWFGERGIPFERSVKHSGRSGRTWTIDFQTFTDARTSLIFLLCTGSRAAARRLTEHVVAGWYDLSHLKVVQPHLAFVSLFDDTEDVWREEDFRLLEEISEIARWSRPDEFEKLLRGEQDQPLVRG